MDADDIFSKQLKQMEKEKRDKESKLRAQEKKVSYLLAPTHWLCLCCQSSETMKMIINICSNLPVPGTNNGTVQINMVSLFQEWICTIT